MAKKSKKSIFLSKHRFCCLCGGEEEATTIDHIPPKSSFPAGYWPDSFEFPACSSCNNGTAKEDLLFGFFSQLVDFNQDERDGKDRARLNKLKQDIQSRYPNAIPDLNTTFPIHQIGMIQTPTPVAYSVQFSKDIYLPALHVLQAKLTHALYYRETGRPLTKKHKFTGGAHQAQGKGAPLTDYFNCLLPETRKGTRINVRNYNNRFMYKFGYKAVDDFFVYAAQFGIGLIMWGLSCPSEIMSDPKPQNVLFFESAGQGPSHYRNGSFAFL